MKFRNGISLKSGLTFAMIKIGVVLATIAFLLLGCVPP